MNFFLKQKDVPDDKKPKHRVHVLLVCFVGHFQMKRISKEYPCNISQKIIVHHAHCIYLC